MLATLVTQDGVQVAVFDSFGTQPFVVHQTRNVGYAACGLRLRVTHGGFTVAVRTNDHQQFQMCPLGEEWPDNWCSTVDKAGENLPKFVVGELQRFLTGKRAARNLFCTPLSGLFGSSAVDETALDALLTPAGRALWNTTRNVTATPAPIAAPVLIMDMYVELDAAPAEYEMLSYVDAPLQQKRARHEQEDNVDCHFVSPVRACFFVEILTVESAGQQQGECRVGSPPSPLC